MPRKLIVQEFLTLDGVMQAPGTKEEDTSDGFTEGGWMIPYYDETVIKLMLNRPYRPIVRAYSSSDIPKTKIPG